MSEGENIYTNETDNRAHLEKIKNAPPEFWEAYPDAGREETIALLEAFLNGANFPYFTDLDENATLWFFPTATSVKDLDDADRPQIQQIQEVRERLDQAREQGNKREAVRLMDANLGVLGTQYKLHLQPFGRDLHKTVTEIAKFISQPAVQQLVYSVKTQGADVRYSPVHRSTRGEFMPQIVVYPYLGREKAQDLVRRASSFFSPDLGMDLAPSYNIKVSELLFLAQSDKGLKYDLRELGLLDKYFDRDTNHAFLSGESKHWEGIVHNIPKSPSPSFGNIRSRLFGNRK